MAPGEPRTPNSRGTPSTSAVFQISHQSLYAKEYKQATAPASSFEVSSQFHSFVIEYASLGGCNFDWGNRSLTRVPFLALSILIARYRRNFRVVISRKLRVCYWNIQ